MDYKETYDLSVKTTSEFTVGQRRTFHLIDIENLCAGRLSIKNIKDVLSRYENNVPRGEWGEYDLFVIACDVAHLQRLSSLVDKKWHAILLPAQGENGADEALVYWLRKYFETGGSPGHLFIASGDHFFEAAARYASAKSATVSLVFRNEISAADALRLLNFPKHLLFARDEIDPLLVIAGEERLALGILINGTNSVNFYVGQPPQPQNWQGYTAFTTTKLGKKMQALEVGDKFDEGKTSYQVIERKILPPS